MKQKIKAFTLMEVTVAMLISAICIGLCYSAYGIITKYYLDFQQKREEADASLALKQVLERDFLTSNYIIAANKGMELYGDSNTIIYAFDQNRILRKINDLHTDTFKLNSTDLLFEFEGKAVLEQDTLDQVSFRLLLGKQTKVPIEINKLYSSENLFH